jgi:hypothetical protein
LIYFNLEGGNKMSLIDCPECNQKISNKALYCLHCGYPINDNPASKIEVINTKLNMLNDNKVPIWEKSNLTLSEAAEYSNIGINRLTMLIKNPHCKFVLFVGNKKLIKRKLFDDFINSVDMI